MVKETLQQNPNEYLDTYLDRPLDAPYTVDYGVNESLAYFDAERPGPGALEYQVDNNTIRYEYDEIYSIPARTLRASPKMIEVSRELDSWRELKMAKITNRETNKELDIVQEAGPECRVLFKALENGRTANHGFDSNGQYIPEANLILLESDISRPFTFLTLGHEYGHAEHVPDDPTLYSNQGLRGRLGASYTRKLADRLRGERTAWATFLSKMRPFMSNDREAVFSKERIMDVSLTNPKSGLGWHQEKIKEMREAMIMPTIKRLGRRALSGEIFKDF